MYVVALESVFRVATWSNLESVTHPHPTVPCHSNPCHCAGFHLTPLDAVGTPRRVYMFKPASVRSLWSAVQYLLKILECSDGTFVPWMWLEYYRHLAPDPAKSVIQPHANPSSSDCARLGAGYSGCLLLLLRGSAWLSGADGPSLRAGPASSTRRCRNST